MLVPRQVSAIGVVAAKESTRYAFNGIRLERTKDGKPRALATDGRRAIIATWDEADATSYPPVEGLEPGKHVENFGTILPVDAMTKASKACPKLGKGWRAKPILENFVVDEPSANGTVKLAANRLDSIERIEATSIEGQFPPVDDVVPTRHEVIGAGRSQKAGDDEFVTIRMRVKKNASPNTQNRCGAVVALNIDLLKGLLDAMSKGGFEFVTLSVPISATPQPIRLDGFNNGNARDEHNVKMTGILMPVNRQ